MKKKSEQDDPNQRLQAILRGAFAGPPTPLKDIPKRNGESRLTRDDQPPRRRRARRLRQRKNRAA